MQTLKLEEKVINVVDYNDLDDFISFHYGVPFEVVADQEMNNYSSKLIKVEKENLDQWQQEDLNYLKESGDYKGGSLRTLLADLCNRGHLAPGNYLIQVFW